MENTQFAFDIKDLGDSKVIILNHSRLDELWTLTEYFLLNEVILQNALFMNYFHVLDILRSDVKLSSNLPKILRKWWEPKDLL